MILVEHSVHTSASPEKIWAKLTDVANWNEWDKNIEFSDLDGPFDVESTGVLKAPDGKATVFMITEMELYKRFVDKSKFGFGDLVVSYYLDHKEEETILTNKIEVEGPLALLIALFYGKKFKMNLPKCLKNFIDLVESDK